MRFGLSGRTNSEVFEEWTISLQQTVTDFKPDHIENLGSLEPSVVLNFYVVLLYKDKMYNESRAFVLRRN